MRAAPFADFSRRTKKTSGCGVLYFANVPKVKRTAH